MKPTDDRDELVSVIKDAVDMMGTTAHPPQTLDENDNFAHSIAHGLRNLPNPLIRERKRFAFTNCCSKLDVWSVKLMMPWTLYIFQHNIII